MKIRLEEYNPDWRNRFEKEKQLLIKTLSDLSIKVEHIGSTAVQGLKAKPVIDIMIGLDDFKNANDQIGKLEKIGYRYISAYENVMPFRRFFIKENMGQRTHHIHMVQSDTEFWERHILFRNHLRQNKADREEYNRLKLELVKKDWIDGNEYADAKTGFIRRIEKKAKETDNNKHLQ